MPSIAAGSLLSTSDCEVFVSSSGARVNGPGDGLRKSDSMSSAKSLLDPSYRLICGPKPLVPRLGESDKPGSRSHCTHLDIGCKAYENRRLLR